MRILGLFFLALAILVGLVDYSRTEPDAGVLVTFRPLGAVWHEAHSASLQQIQPAIERHVSPWLWEAVVFPVLATPAVVVFLIACVLCFVISALIGRRRRR